MLSLIYVTLAALMSGLATAQTVVPFDLDGRIEGIQATDPTLFNTGGTITVYGTPITIPSNLLVQFPAAWVPFQQFARDAASWTGYEVSISGNKVDDVHIAGTVVLSELLGGGGSGIISTVNTDGTMQIKNGPLLRVNTPNNVYAQAYSGKPFLTSDEQNPTIASFSGYPMCVPRSVNDPDCPANNRPTDGSLVYTPQNTSAMAPFLPGDFVTWAGVKNGANEVACYSITAETLQQLTSADAGDPVYVRVEDALIGVNSGFANAEFGQTRFVGYLSDPTVTVSVYRIEIDPCTGEETEVQVAADGLKPGDARNKFDIRFREQTLTKAAREYRIRASKGVLPGPKGIQAGQYVTPISEIIWPEVDVPGTAWPELPFNQFSHFANGFVFDGKQYGQLKPWPGKQAPTPAKICTGTELGGGSAPPPSSPPPAGQTPVASAGLDLNNQLAGSLITLTGKNTNTALSAAQLTFQWTGPAGITIKNANKETMSFVDPWQDPVTTPTSTRTFTFKACLASDSTVCSSDTVDVVTNRFVDKVTITAYQFVNRQGGTITVSATSDNVLTDANRAKLEVQFSGTGAWVAMNQDPNDPALYTYSVRSFGKQPSSVSVRSSHNSVPVSTTNLVKRMVKSLRS